MRKKSWCIIVAMAFISGCTQLNDKKTNGDSLTLPVDTPAKDPPPGKPDTSYPVAGKAIIKTGNVQPRQLIGFAKTLVGIKYKYGSTDPSAGFDCSGFITYVFNHFNIKVPRSSIDFTNVGRTIPLDAAKLGDLILFTGTDSTERYIGHMGIITADQNGAIEFIHSTSGKQYGVTITALNRYYLGRFIRVARIFE
jgi:cell wall-associated NlpC family hydrolase